MAAFVCPSSGISQTAANDPIRSEPSVPRLAAAARLIDDNQIESAVALLEELATSPEDSAEVRRLLGRAYYQSARWADALGQFEAALRMNPENELARLDMAYLYLGANLPDQADAALAGAVLAFPTSGNPRYQDLYFALAESFADAGRIGIAKRSMARAASFDGPVEKIVIFKRLGDFATQLVEFDPARDAYLDALTLDPEDVDSRIALGSLYLRDNRPDDALRELARVLDRDPDNVTALTGIAETYLATDNLSEAARAAERAVELVPDNRRARYVLGRSLVRMGRDEEGRNELEEYRRLEARFQDLDHRAREIHAFQSAAMVHLINGQTETAIALLEEAIEELPQSTDLRLSLGLALSQSLRHRAAVVTFTELLRMPAAEAATVHRHLEREYRLLGDPASSRRHRELADRLEAAPGGNNLGGPQ